MEIGKGEMIMGRRGPQPKPTQLKILEGNPGKQKLNEAEPKPPILDAIPDPPKRLMKEAKKEWKRLAPTMVASGLLTTVDLSAFAELCQCYAYYLAVDAEICKEANEKGPLMMQTSTSGYTQAHPLLSLRKQYYDTWHKGLADFGLTPSSRSRIITGDPIGGTNKNGSSNAGSDDDMERLLRKHGC